MKDIAREMIANRLTRDMSRMYGGHFNTSPKRNHYADFGYPDDLHFDDYHALFSRNGIAAGLINKTIAKVWETNPWLMEVQPEDRNGDAETATEAAIRRRFADMRLWQMVREADRRSYVGHYAGLILRYRDGADMREPVARVPGGLNGLYEVIPVWQSQLTISKYVDDPTSVEYGEPAMFQFNEASIYGASEQQKRQFHVHPDRVVIFSEDGSVSGLPALEASYNALLDLEKISGAGGEGFFRNASQRLALEASGDGEFIRQLADTAFEGDTSAAVDAINDQVQDFMRGFDKALMLQGLQAKPISVTLANPKEFFEIALQVAASPFGIPTKELVGNQQGERASTEDAEEWAKSAMSRREGRTIPAVMQLVRKLTAAGVLPERDWHLDWPSLLDATPNDMLERAERMAKINQTNAIFGQVFTDAQIQEAAGFEPDDLGDEAGFDDVDDDEGEA